MTGEPASVPYWRLSGFYFFYFALVGVLVPYWSLYLQALGYSPYEIGVVAAILMLTRIFAPNIWGWLADRHGNRLGFIRLGSLAAFVCFCGIFLSSRYQWLLWVVVSFSFFWNAVLAQFEVLTLAHLYPDTGRYSLIRQWGSIGFIAAVIGLGYLLNAVDILHLPLVIATLLLLIWLASLTVAAKELGSAESTTTRFGHILRRRSVWLFLLVGFLLQVSHGPYYTFYSIYLRSLGYAPDLVGWLWAIGVLAEVVLFWFMRRLLSLCLLETLLLVGLACTVLRWCLIGLLADSLGWLLLAQLLHAASFGLTHVVSIEWIRRQFSTGGAGQGQALYSALTFGAGGAFGAILSGVVWSWSPQMTFFGAAILALIGLLLALGLKNTTE